MSTPEIMALIADVAALFELAIANADGAGGTRVSLHLTRAREMQDRLRRALSQQPAAVDEETAWREGWALAYSGADKLYGDDGELQDASDHPFIDWRRDSATEIRRKIQERGMRALSRLGGES